MNVIIVISITITVISKSIGVTIMYHVHGDICSELYLYLS